MIAPVVAKVSESGGGDAGGSADNLVSDEAFRAQGRSVIEKNSRAGKETKTLMIFGRPPG